MDNDVKQMPPPQSSPDAFDLAVFFHTNRQKIIQISGIVLAVIVVSGGYVWYKNYKESTAAEALSNVKSPASVQEEFSAKATDADPYLKVADDYSGTGAASRALLIAGGIVFDAGKFDQAQGIFERFEREYPDSPLVSQAMIGVASSLEAKGKSADAATHYDQFIKAHSSDPVIPQAKSALARLYIAQNKPELAMHLYEEMGRANNNDSWTMESGIQLQELLAKYPNLRKPVAPAPAPAATAVPSIKPTTSSTVTVPTLK